MKANTPTIGRNTVSATSEHRGQECPTLTPPSVLPWGLPNLSFAFWGVSGVSHVMGSAGLWDPWGTREAAGRLKPCALVRSAKNVRHESAQGGHSSGPHRRTPLPCWLSFLHLQAPMLRGGTANLTRRERPGLGPKTLKARPSPPGVSAQTPTPAQSKGRPGLGRPSPHALALPTGTILVAGQAYQPQPLPSDPQCWSAPISATESGQPRIQLWGVQSER